MASISRFIRTVGRFRTDVMKDRRQIESVWSYPRPPTVVIDHREVVVAHRGITIARTSNAVRVLETSHPPTFYLPSEDVETAFLTASDGRTFCEFKGFASYWNVEVGGVVAARAAWSYPSPNPGYEALRETIAFYPGRVDACSVDGEIVEPQPGGFYGGWITSDIEGPFKGAPGTSVW